MPVKIGQAVYDSGHGSRSPQGAEIRGFVRFAEGEIEETLGDGFLEP
jgi:hypothetical protein